MAWTKRQLVKKAFGKIGLASYIYDIKPAQLQSAAQDMDAMVGEWETKGVRIKYPFAADPDNIDLDTEVDSPAGSIQALYSNLAVLIASDFGKVVPLELKKLARSSYKNLLLLKPLPQEMQFPSTMPAGAGNKPWREGYGPFLPKPDDSPLQIGKGGELEFLE